MHGVYIVRESSSRSQHNCHECVCVIVCNIIRVEEELGVETIEGYVKS